MGSSKNFYGRDEEFFSVTIFMLGFFGLGLTLLSYVMYGHSNLILCYRMPKHLKELK